MTKKQSKVHNASFGAFFRKYLGDSPLSDHALALRIGIAATSLNGYCNGQHFPAHINQMKILLYISRTQNVPVGKLYKECIEYAIQHKEIEG
jgi:hypothetical protein